MSTTINTPNTYTRLIKIYNLTIKPRQNIILRICNEVIHTDAIRTAPSRHGTDFSDRQFLRDYFVGPIVSVRVVGILTFRDGPV